MKLPKLFLPHFLILSLILLLPWICSGQISTFDDLIKRSDFDNEIVNRTKDVHNALIKLYDQGNAKYKDSKTNTCDAFSFIKNVKKEKLIPNPLDLYHGFLDILVSRQLDSISFKDKGKYGFLKSQQDRMFASWSKSKNFFSFVSNFTGKDISEIEKADVAKLDKAYKSLNRMFDTKRVFRLNQEYRQYSQKFNEKHCTVTTQTTLRSLNYSFPNRNWELKTSIAVNCTCAEGSKPTVLESALYEYKGSIASIFTNDDVKFDPKSIKNAKLTIEKVSCCPEKTEKKTSSVAPTEKKTSSAAPTEGSHFIKDTRDIFLNPQKVNEYKNYVVTEWGKDEEEDRLDAEGSFFREAGSFAYGVSLGKPVGEEKDFYGFTYGAKAEYLFGEDGGAFYFGPEVSYTRYTGKDTDFGFETEGVSYITASAKASYSFNDWLAITGSVGYGIPTSDGVDGGLAFSLGPEISPGKKKTSDVSSSTRIYYSLRFESNSSGGDSSFKSVNAGVGLRLD